jgi:hypothetical protein
MILPAPHTAFARRLDGVIESVRSKLGSARRPALHLPPIVDGIWTNGP